MSTMVRILIVLLVLVGLGGLITLAMSSVSPTIKRVEMVIPDDRFPR